MNLAVDLVEKPEIVNPSVRVAMRRASYADIERHKVWLVPRMIKTYPELNMPSAIGWLKGFTASNEYLFLAQDNSIALFQLMPGYTLVPAQIVQERFVWCVDPKDEGQIEEAAEFYGECYLWASRLNGVQNIIVDENTDVPRSLIEKCMVTDHKCRLLKREMSYVRIRDR